MSMQIGAKQQYVNKPVAFGAIQYPISHWRCNNSVIKEIENQASKFFGAFGAADRFGEADTVLTEYGGKNSRKIEKFVAEELIKLGLKVKTNVNFWK
ncbi:MAG: hypothetical protein WCG23_09750 [bacterium]